MDRALFFVDGSNWYHSLRKIGLHDLGRLMYPRICQKLAAGRTWVATRYYIADVGIVGNPALLIEQRAFLSRLRAQDSRITVHLGRLEPRVHENEGAGEFRRCLDRVRDQIPDTVLQELLGLTRRHAHSRVFVEKAVDVQIAVDIVTLAERGEYDAAYLLSADGDFTPAVDAVRQQGRAVFAVSPSPGARLASAASAYIRLDRRWFDDCFR